MVSDLLHSEIKAAGFKMKAFKAEHLEEISDTIKKLVKDGLLDEDFFNQNLQDFNYDYKGLLPGAKSVIVIAAPQSKSLAEFTHQGRVTTIVVPPTYITSGITNQIAGLLEHVLSGNGFHFAKLVLPLKLLAVKSGLGQYGRNNICYVDGLGSFVRLTAYITDLEFSEDNWGEVKVMESCEKCSACADHCPTGAIDREQFLIHAQRCITHFNEENKPIPEWIRPEWHNAVVGCTICQFICPHNKKLVDQAEKRIAFNEAETGLILDGCSFNELPVETGNKIASIGMKNYYSVLPRNIRLIMMK